MPAGPVVVLGASSLVGSDLAVRRAASGDLLAVGRSDPARVGVRGARFLPVDLADPDAVRRFFRGRRGDAAWVNFAARTDVDGCEGERPSGGEGERPPATRRDTAWRMNAELPGELAELSAESGTPLVHLSTDFVFDGRDGPYDEGRAPSPFGPGLGWYGRTKGVGEERIRASGAPATIIRLSYPYRSGFPPKPDFARAILARARAGTLYPLYDDQRITPTWVPDVTAAIDRLLDAPDPGTVHIASPVATSPWEFGRELLLAFGMSVEGVRPGRFAEAPAGPGRAPRPRSGGLLVDRARRAGYALTDFRAGVRALRAATPD